MKMKRFFAKDMRTALAEVKETLGSDAVIMSNKKVTGGIEIVAAVEAGAAKPSVASEREVADDNVNISSARQASGAASAAPSQKADEMNNLRDNLADFMQRHQQRQQQRFEEPKKSPAARPMTAPQPLSQQASWGKAAASQAPINRGAASDVKREEFQAMKGELAEMRKLLEHQVSGLMAQEMERQEPIRAMLMKRLQRVGFSDEMADQVAGYIPEDCSLAEGWEHLKSLLSNQLSLGHDDILSQGGAVALLGPTGVGKTTTIAKLAAQFAMRYGADSVAMITSDTYRIGAHEQLATYGKIMGCAVRVANDEEELSQLLYQFKDKRLVLIDTAGMSQRDLRLHEQLDRLVKNSRVNIRNYLVLSANAQRRVIEETVAQFQKIPLSGTILTKLDECIALGEALDVSLRHALPISYVTNGQRVPEDIAVADASYLVEQALAAEQEASQEMMQQEAQQQDKVTDVY